LLLATALTCRAHAGETLRLAVGEHPPYYSEKLADKGALSALVFAAFAREGVAVTLEFYPWRRSLLLAKANSVDGTPGWTETEERRRDFVFSAPFYVARDTILFRKDTPVSAQSLADLKGRTVGVVAGNTYGAEFDSMVQSGVFNVDVASDDATNLRKLLARRVDLITMNRGVANSMLLDMAEAEAQRVQMSSLNLTSKPWSLAVSKSHPKAQWIIQTFNAGLAKIKKDGTAARLTKGLGVR
jgi:polar amino acid transport system substrate-binding protein